jgi:hypothetical protein
VVFHDPNPHTALRLFGCHALGAPYPYPRPLPSY